MSDQARDTDPNRHAIPGVWIVAGRVVRASEKRAWGMRARHACRFVAGEIEERDMRALLEEWRP